MSIHPGVGRPTRLHHAILATLAALLLACGSPWKVITSSGPPSALKGVTAYAVTMSYDGLMVGKKSESEYVSGKDADAAASFAGDKAGMEEALRRQLGGNKAGYTFDGGEITVHVNVNMIEPGFYAAVAKMPTSVVSTVTFKKGDQVLDVIEVVTAQDADIYRPSSGQRMRICAEQLGDRIVAFLKKANK